MHKTRLILLAALTALVLSTSAGAGNLSVDMTRGSGPGTSATCPNGCRLSVNMTGDTVKAFVSDNSPSSERVYRANFYINPNNLNMPQQSSLRLMEIRKGSPAAQVYIQGDLVFRDGLYKVRFSAFDDGGAIRRAGQLTLNADKNALIEVEWSTASTANANDGLLLIRKGNKTKQIMDIDNFHNGSDGIDQIRFGYVKGGSNAITGNFFLDDFSSFRTLSP